MSFKVYLDDFRELQQEITDKMKVRSNYGYSEFNGYKRRLEELLEDVSDLASMRGEDVLARKLSEFKDDDEYFHEEKPAALIAKIIRIDRVIRTFGEHLFPNSSNIAAQVGTLQPPAQRSKDDLTKVSSKDVFVVHGHDEAVLHQVSDVIRKLALNPIVLRDQPNQGKTIIEKFEANAEVGFAVVLMTADDMGESVEKAQEGEFQQRARQNVVLELGYFCGSLTRSRVCVLKANGVEEPSDILGVVYTPIDPNRAWQLVLGKELKAAGYKVDLNNL